MYNIIKQYDNLLNKFSTSNILFGETLQHSLSDGFPIISDELINFDNVISELKWYLQGRVDVKTLWSMGNHSWDDILYDRYKIWTLNNNHLGLQLFTKDEFIKTIKEVPDFSDGWAHPGPMYGKQWRDFNGIDQLEHLVNDIKNNSDKILYLSNWNTNELQFMAHKPTHNGFQIHRDGNELSMSLSILRCDITSDLPHLIALYSLFLEVLSKSVSLTANKIVINMGEVLNDDLSKTINYNTNLPYLKIQSADILNGNFKYLFK